MSDTTQASQDNLIAFTFGDPDATLDMADIADYAETWWQGDWYEPPVSWIGLAKTFRAAVHHASALYFKRNCLVSTYQPHQLLSKEAFSGWALDYLIFGNAFLLRQSSRSGRPLSLRPLKAKYVRRGQGDRYWWVPSFSDQQELQPNTCVHLLEPDINQEIYGLPTYLAGLNSMWLNESATLFRRKYYKNGSHAGYILYISDAMHDERDITALRNALRDSKGPGNFRNLFLYAPNGKKDGIQILPIAEVMARDDFLNIKSVSRDDMLAIHRVPPQLMGIIPQSGAAFGDALTAAHVFSTNEIAPLQERLAGVNALLGEEVVRFKPYALPAMPGTNPVTP